MPGEFGRVTVAVRRPNPVVVLWRWRYEVAAGAGLVAAQWRFGPVWTVLIGLAVVAVVAATPLRNYAWCVLTQHRVRTACKHLWLHSRTGRLPMVVWTRPVPGGTRCWLWVRPGVAADDVARVREQLAAACWARDVDAEPDARHTQLVRLTVWR